MGSPFGIDPSGFHTVGMGLHLHVPKSRLPTVIDIDGSEVRFLSAKGAEEVRGISHSSLSRTAMAGLVVAHGRSNDMRNPFIRRLAEAAAEHGIWAMRFNFRYVDAKQRASRDLSVEEDDLRGAVSFARGGIPGVPIFVAGKSMGARVCALASSAPAIAGVIALGYPLHPPFPPQVMNPPEWPKLGNPALFRP